MAAAQPRLSIRLWWKLCTTLAHRPVVLLACLFWSLRCFELLAAINRDKPDLVHLYWGHVPSMLGWLILESVPETTVTTSLGAYDLEFALPLGFEVAARCGGVRTWADPNGSDIASHKVPRENINLLYKGISLKAFAGASTASGRRDPHQMLFAGRLIPEKGVTLVIDVVDRIHLAFPDAKLAILGDGPLRATLQSRVNALGLGNTIEFRGHVSSADVVRELQQSSIFMLPSNLPSERLPNVIKEAAAAGCCCLTTATPGIETLIRDGESGRILPADDLDAWVTAVTELLSDPERAQKMADAANRRVHEHFDIERTTDQLIAWWDSLLAKSANASRGSL